MKILIVDDEQIVLTSIRRLLKRRGFHNVRICDNGPGAIEEIKKSNFDLVLLDLLMPDVDGIEVLKTAKPFAPHTEFMILTAVDEVATAVRAIRLGAYDYLVKPIDNERLLLSIQRAYEHLGLLAGLAGSCTRTAATRIPESFSHIITQNPRMIELLTFAQIMAKSGNPILVTGESGTGKELLARGIHKCGPGQNGPFVAVNVSAIPENLFESQFFGHLKGSFTGADRDYTGFFEQAAGGTLFLDEIGDLPMRLQSKLLRVLEEKMVIPIGSTRSIRVNPQIVSATNIDIENALKDGRFRLDLMCRLKSVHVHLPPLSEREGDIPLLASHFLLLACKRHKKAIQGFSSKAMELLVRKAYPGNIRSLSQEVENAVILSEADIIQPHHLGESQASTSILAPALCSLREERDRHVAYVLTHTRGDRKQAAEILGVTLRHVQRILSQMKENPRWREFLDAI